jgi:hypothetical protein
MQISLIFFVLFTVIIKKDDPTMELLSNSRHLKGEITFYSQDQQLWSGLSASLLSGAS